MKNTFFVLRSDLLLQFSYNRVSWFVNRGLNHERQDMNNENGSGLMSRVCYFTGKRTTAGRSIARRGKAKYLGGVGRKVTGITKRKFKPNIQKVRAVIDGKVCRIKVSAKAIRMGLVQKPPKRNYTSTEEHKSAGV